MSKSSVQAKGKRRGKAQETAPRFLVGGKWITAAQREAKISRLEIEISQLRETLRVNVLAGISVSDLIHLAEKGDKLSVIQLFMIAVETVSAVNSIAQRRPELVLNLSRALFFWPAFISRKRALKLDNAKLMKTLQLGEGGVYSKTRWQPSAPSTQVAFGLFSLALLHKNEWRLPPLAKKNKRTWFEASWNHLLLREGIVPEQTPKLAQLGKSAIGKKSISRGMPEQTAGMRRDDVRAEIKRQIWNAFNTLIAAPEK